MFNILTQITTVAQLLTWWPLRLTARQDEPYMTFFSVTAEENNAQSSSLRYAPSGS